MPPLQALGSILGALAGVSVSWPIGVCTAGGSCLVLTPSSWSCGGRPFDSAVRPLVTCGATRNSRFLGLLERLEAQVIVILNMEKDIK